RKCDNSRPEILDIAGGRGELGFELVNLNGIPTTIVDPRAPDLERYIRKWDLGLYHRPRKTGLVHVPRGQVEAKRGVHHVQRVVAKLQSDVVVEEGIDARRVVEEDHHVEQEDGEVGQIKAELRHLRLFFDKAL
ncbi:unnamed protein product, partial [Amoebophrya sp. A25]